MDWKEYCACLTQIQKTFGSYSQDEITKGYMYWKPKPQSELIDFVSTAIHSRVRPSLYDRPKISSVVHPDHKNDWKKELTERVISDDALDKLLKENSVTSLVDLVFKK